MMPTRNLTEILEKIRRIAEERPVPPGTIMNVKTFAEYFGLSWPGAGSVAKYLHLAQRFPPIEFIEQEQDGRRRRYVRFLPRNTEAGDQ